MFGFFTKLKTEVYAGFDAVHQRIITLEAKVEALFNHTKAQAETATTAAVDAAKTDVSDVKADVTKAETVVTDATATVEAAKE